MALIHCICLSVKLINSVYRKDKNFYPQVFLEEDKCIVKEKKMCQFITDDIDIYSNDSEEQFWWRKLNTKVFFRKIQNMFNLEAGKFHSRKYKKKRFFEKWRRFTYRLGTRKFLQNSRYIKSLLHPQNSVSF